jgi:hypothetical protein
MMLILNLAVANSDLRALVGILNRFQLLFGYAALQT